MRTVILCLVVLLAPDAFADDVSEVREQLARDVFEASGGVARLRSTMATLVSAFETSYMEFYVGLAEEISFKSESERSAFLESSAESANEFFSGFDLLEHVGYYEAAIDVLVPIYADLYSEEELRQLLAFLRSPVGQKMNSTQGERIGRATQELLLMLQPKIQREIERAFREERERLFAAWQ